MNKITEKIFKANQRSRFLTTGQRYSLVGLSGLGLLLTGGSIFTLICNHERVISAMSKEIMENKGDIETLFNNQETFYQALNK